MRKVTICFWTICVLLYPHLAEGWSSAGHLVVAAEAFRELSPELKAQVFGLLKAHPDYAKWEAAYHPNPIFDLPAYVFLRSSSWPDEIRRSGNQYDHPNWHFIDYPLRPPNFPLDPSPSPSNDVLYGVKQCEMTLGNTNSSNEMRAVCLSYLVHLVGDMHQPLHCASLFTDVYSTGDRGGNDFYVKPDRLGVRLHGIWDSLLGSSGNARAQWSYAIELQARFPRAALPELTRHVSPKEWSLESRLLALEKGYLRGSLAGATNSDGASSLPSDYLRTAKLVAEKQGALGGYRLADEITQYLKWGAELPLLPENTNTAAFISIPKRIGISEASKYYDESIIVTGKVMQVSIRPKITILNLGNGDSPFTAVVFEESNGRFGDLHKLEGRNVEISGTITEYRNEPEIIMETESQISVLGGK